MAKVFYKIMSVFLDNVTYGPEVRFVSISKFMDYREHYETRDIFIEAAKTNLLEGWEIRGIPPIFAYLVNNKYRHLLGEGQTRLNSARHVGADCYVPIWDITGFMSAHEKPNTFIIKWIYTPNCTIDWNLNKNPLKLSDDFKTQMNDDDFAGFS